jgi:vitamin B12 transporter
VAGSKFAVVFLIISLSLSFVSSAVAMSEKEREFLLLYFDEEDLVIVSTTRSLKSITRVAENVEVVTAADIELMNAHTVADVLNTVNGVQVFNAGAGPGSIAQLQIQGSSHKHVMVFIDGMPFNFVSNNYADAGVIPVQNVERIEIIKGPASSAWGSSLGGVVNVITKSTGTEEKTKGTLSASYGERNTGDFRVDAYGKKDKFGYYFSAGRLQTDGLRPHFDLSQNNIMTKLSYNFTDTSNLVFTLFYNEGTRGEGDDPWFVYSDKFRDLLSSLSYKRSLSGEMDLNLSIWQVRRLYHSIFETDTGIEVYKDDWDDTRYGANARLIWSHEIHSIVVGTDLEKGTVEADVISDEWKREKWAVYANDTIVLDKLSVTPGIRYDHSSLSSGFVSPSLGITYQVAKGTLARAYVSRGFSEPELGMLKQFNAELKPEKVWSYQLGAETVSLKYVWLKVSAFRHDIDDAIDHAVRENKDKLRRQGLEVGFRTLPVYHTTFFGGATFIKTKNIDTGDEVRNVKYTYDVGLKYDDEKTFRALFKGHYIWWNVEDYTNSKYDAMVFDLNLIKKIYTAKDRTAEIFLTGHNIFNGSQYLWDAFKNSGRWIEAGVRFKF